MKQDSQKLWRVLSDLGYREKTKIKCSKISLYVDGSLISDQIKVATHFNRCFTMVAEKLVNELPAQIGIFNDKLVKEYYAKWGIMPGGFFVY